MADVIQLYSALGASYRISLEARRSVGPTVEAIVVTASDKTNAVLGQGEFKVAFDIPDKLICGARLKTWSEIQADIKKKREAAETDRAVALERLRDQLREELANLSINVNAATGAFLGIDGVGFAGADATAQLAIDLLLLDPTLKPEPANDVAVLTARLRAKGMVQLGGHTCTAAMLLDIVVTRGALINAIPSLSLDAPAAAKIPVFDFRWPRAEWPSLSWSTLDVTRLATLLRFDLPIPKTGDLDQPLHVKWSTKPQIAFAVDPQRQLTIATTQNGTGELVCDTKAANGAPSETKIADITGFNIALSSGGNLSLAGKITGANVPVALPRKVIDRPDALPFIIEIDPGELTIKITADIDLPQAAGANVTATLGRVPVRGVGGRAWIRRSAERCRV